jgi:hypothetical protein
MVVIRNYDDFVNLVAEQHGGADCAAENPNGQKPKDTEKFALNELRL